MADFRIQNPITNSFSWNFSFAISTSSVLNFDDLHRMKGHTKANDKTQDKNKSVRHYCEFPQVR